MSGIYSFSGGFSFIINVMYKIIETPPPEGGPEAPFSEGERIIVQRNLLASLGETTEGERLEWLRENSGPFRELEEGPDFRRLVREGDFTKVLARIEAFKKEKREEQEKNGINFYK